MDNKTLKGEGLQNRYRITGKLVTVSPLHVGAGGEREITDPPRRPRPRRAEAPSPQEAPETHTASTVMKDASGKPSIPGSALKGVMRHWLLNVFQGLGDDWATHRPASEYGELANLGQEEQIERVRTFSWLEVLFGTPLHEGKVEVWDAACLTEGMSAPDSLLRWDEKSLTYIDTSVAIEPETGTAVEHLLYQSEVVPPGVTFELNVVAQNLSEIELGMVLLALKGFNSTIYPVRVGARGGRGYGRLRFEPGPVYALRNEGEIVGWIRGTIEGLDAAGEAEDKPGAAGYYALPKLDEEEQKRLIAQVKQQFSKALGG